MTRTQEDRSPASPPPLVVLVLGFLRTGLSMMPMALALRRRGFEARVVSQFNLHASIPDLADALYPRVLAMRRVVARRTGCEPALHFVTHSMGGIVVRSMLARHSIEGLNRVVMLAPPNQGSRLAAYVHDELLRFPWGSFDPLRKLLPGERGDCVGVGDVDAEIGIIAGGSERSYAFPWSLGGLIHPEKFGELSERTGGHDGAVGLDEVRMDLATDLLVVQRSHTFMMAMPEVAEQAAHFLRRGRFKHAASA
ncbi:MAG: hypothetical protein VX498_13820 [Myxococcota bacterium]|nr:hypothetical protein [Myxococcota bacterium]